MARRGGKGGRGRSGGRRQGQTLSVPTPFASPFDADPFSMTEEELVGNPFQSAVNGLVEEGDLGTAFDLSTTVTNPDTGITAFQSTIREQDYGEAPVYADSDIALNNYLDFYNRVQAQQAATDSVYNYNQYDPSDFARMGFSGATAVSDRAGVDVVQDFLTENEVPLSKEINGQTFYLNTGIGTPESYGARGDGEYVNLGGVGTYSTVFVENPSGVEMVLTNPVVNALLMATLPPVVRNTITLATADDPVRAAVAMLGGQYINDALAQAGVTGASLGLSPEQFESAVNSTVEGVAEGEDIGEAVVSSFGKEVISNVDIDLPEFDIDLSSFGLDIDTPEAVKQLEDLIKEGGSAIEDVVRTGGEVLEPVIQPIIDTASEVVSPIEDVVREVGSTTEDVVRTVGSTAEDIVEPLKDPIETVGSATEDVVREVGSTLEDIIEPIKDPLLDALSGVNLSSLTGINMDGTYRPSVSNIPTQVEELFSDELFKFETEIGISDQPYFEYEEFYDNDLMPRQQLRTYSF